MTRDDAEYLESVFNNLGPTDSKYGHPDNQKRLRESYPGSTMAVSNRKECEACFWFRLLD